MWRGKLYADRFDRHYSRDGDMKGAIHNQLSNSEIYYLHPLKIPYMGQLSYERWLKAVEIAIRQD